MTRLEELQKQYDQNVAALADIKAKRSADGTFPDDVKEQLRRCNEDYARIMADIEAERAIEKREKDAALMEFHQRAAQTSATPAPQFQSGNADAAANYEGAFWRFMTRAKNQPVSAEDLRMLETRGTSTQITGTDSLGGYLVPTQFSNQIENMMKWHGGMMEACTIYDDAIGGTLEWPTGDDTSVSGNINTAANEAAQRTVTDFTIGQLTFGDWIIDSGIVKTSLSLLQSERVNMLQDFILNNMSERIGRKRNTTLTNGTGTNQPYGLTVMATNNALTSASATALTAAELIRAQAAVDYSYQQGPKAGWMMHQTILAYLRTLDFSTSTSHIFIPGNLAAGEPDRLLGKPIFVNNDLPAANASTGLPVTATRHIFLGDFSKYVIRRTREISIRRSDERYFDELAVGFLGWMRLDGRLVNANAVKGILQA